MWNEILVGIGAGVTFFMGTFTLGKYAMKNAWNKNELELRSIQKELIQLQSLDPENKEIKRCLSDFDKYFLEFYSEDHFDWSRKKGYEKLNNKEN